MPMPARPAQDAASLLDELDTLRSELAHLRTTVEHQSRLAVTGTIASLIAHEFNNLMTPIASYAQIALDSPDDQQLVHKALSKSHQNAKQAAEIARAILDFARPDDPSPISHPFAATTQKHTARVGRTLDEALTCLARDPARDRIALSISVPNDIQVALRPVALQHVLLNVLLNARNALVPGGGEIAIVAETVDAPPPTQPNAVTSADGSPWHAKGRWIAITIRDTGKGIPTERLQRLFQPFTTTHNNPTEQYTGSGLGMNVCKTLLDAAGGFMQVHSQTGTGTTVQIFLPDATSSAAKESA